MKELIDTLKKLGYTSEQIRTLRAKYMDDPEGFRVYVLYTKAVFDDSHEWIKEDAYALG